MDKIKYDAEILMPIVKNKLIIKGLIEPYETIRLTACHDIVIDNVAKNHYVIHRGETEKKFFLKMLKRVDGIIHCDEYISASNHDGNYTFPHILVSPFSVNNDSFFITNYISGYDLDELDLKLSDEQWKKAAEDIRIQLCILANIHTPYYSEKNVFLTYKYPKIFEEKLKARIKHISLNSYDRSKIQIACNNSLRILNSSTFSKPSLIHMDVKPANIIFDFNAEKAALIDFESARFGDLDFGIVQLILTQFNSFSENYKKKMFPWLTQGLTTIDQAYEIPKLQVYLWYQTMCNIIYYYNHNTPCPNKMKEIFENMLNKLLQW